MKFFLLLIAICILTSCGSINQTGSTAQQVATVESTQVNATMQIPNATKQSLGRNSPAQVRLNIFSGRPAPSWILTLTDTLTLRDMLNAVQPSKQAMPETNLGYQGFEVELSNCCSETIDTFIVYKSFIKHTTESSTQVLDDKDRKIEQFLVAQAKPHIDPEIYATLQEQSQAP